jgi:putative hydrolase of the HAD superfamily
MKAALFQHTDWLRMDRGTLTEIEALANLEQRTGRPKAELAGLFEVIRNSLKPKDDTVALIERLAQRQIPLYCLSNMSGSTFAYVREKHAFWTAFRGIVSRALSLRTVLFEDARQCEAELDRWLGAG